MGSEAGQGNGDDTGNGYCQLLARLVEANRETRRQGLREGEQGAMGDRNEGMYSQTAEEGLDGRLKSVDLDGFDNVVISKDGMELIFFVVLSRLLFKRHFFFREVSVSAWTYA